DVALKEEGVAELLPAADLVVFDEAHQLPDIATMLLGQTISTGQCQEFLRDLLIEGRTSGADAGDWNAVLSPLEQTLKDIRLAVGSEVENARLSVTQFDQMRSRRELCLKFGQQLEGLLDQLEPLASRSEAWLKLSGRAGELCHAWLQWFEQTAMKQLDSPASVHWVNVSAHNVQFCESPLDVAQAFSTLYEQQPKSWVFTSATLSVKDDLSHFSQRLGLEEANQLMLPSPFDYENQALMCVPDCLPLPNAPRFSDSLCEALWPLLEVSDGGVFFLCTSHRAVQYIAQYLRNRIETESLDWTLLVQGEFSRAELLERFKASDKPVLVGAASFWEGVDIRGHSLRLVVIDKLPFAPPDDPVFQARSEAVQKAGRNPFMDLSVPDAAIALK
ncbi:MAG: ATP-dependent DNA helicase, partial [Limnobacter sp.]|nr:ATP-dependent DNA helicase [Limnobacter sp.]